MQRIWVLVTGASEGIGRAYARLAAQKGFDVIVTARRVDHLETLADEIRAMGREAIVIPADLSQPAEIERLWAEASQGRRIGWLINNAGLGAYGKFADPETWAQERLSMDVNISAMALLMKRALPHMEGAGGGRIVNTASTAAFMPGPGMAIYHASKAFVLSLSQAVADEMRNRGVTVTAVCPGPVRTGFFTAAGTGPVNLTEKLPVLEPMDVARAGWQAALEGRRVVVPGTVNRLLALSARITPTGLLLAIARRVWRKAG